MIFPDSSISHLKRDDSTAASAQDETNSTRSSPPPPPYATTLHTHHIGNSHSQASPELQDNHQSTMGQPNQFMTWGSYPGQNSSHGPHHATDHHHINHAQHEAQHHHSHGRWGSSANIFAGHGRRRGRCGRRGRGCTEGRDQGTKCREHKRKLFRRMLLRFALFFALSMLWIHADAVSVAWHKAVACLPMSVHNTFSAIGHVLSWPMTVSQTFGALFYSAMASIFLTCVHALVIRRRFKQWHARWTEFHRAQHAQAHDHEAWPHHHARIYAHEVPGPSSHLPQQRQDVRDNDNSSVTSFDDDKSDGKSEVTLVH